MRQVKMLPLQILNGKFTITVEANDQLVFVAKNHEIKELKVTAAILKQGFINITLVAKVEELKEVVVQNTPSIKLSKDAKWEQAKRDQYTLEKNASKLKNPGVYDGTIENGMDLMRIGGMIARFVQKEEYRPRDERSCITVYRGSKNTNRNRILYRHFTTSSRRNCNFS